MRWLLAGLLIAMVLIEHAWVWSLLHLVLFFLLLWMLEESTQNLWQYWLKTWRILRWLLIPILIFHAIFTPGEIVWVGFVLPISYEGLTLGFYLSLKLCEMFVCALLLGRLLPMQAWLAAIAHIDILQCYLTPYLRLMPMMLRRVPVLVRRTYRAWRIDPKKVRALAHYITELMIVIDNDSRRRARYVWNTWDKPKSLDLVAQKQLTNHHLNDMGWLLMVYGVFEFGMRYLWS